MESLVVELLVPNPVSSIIVVSEVAVIAVPMVAVTVRAIARHGRLCQLDDLLVLSRHQTSGGETCLKLELQCFDGIDSAVALERGCPDFEVYIAIAFYQINLVKSSLVYRSSQYGTATLAKSIALVLPVADHLDLCCKWLRQFSILGNSQQGA